MTTTNKSTATAIIDDLTIIMDMLVNKFNNPASIKSRESLKAEFLPLAIQVQRNALIYDALLKVGNIDDDRTEPSPLEKIAIEISELSSK